MQGRSESDPMMTPTIGSADPRRAARRASRTVVTFDDGVSDERFFEKKGVSLCS